MSAVHIAQQRGRAIPKANGLGIEERRQREAAIARITEIAWTTRYRECSFTFWTGVCQWGGQHFSNIAQTSPPKKLEGSQRLSRNSVAGPIVGDQQVSILSDSKPSGPLVLNPMSTS